MYSRRSSAFSGVSWFRMSAKARRRSIGPLADLIFSPKAMRSVSERARSPPLSLLPSIDFIRDEVRESPEFEEVFELMEMPEAFSSAPDVLFWPGTNFDPMTKAPTATRAQAR